MESTAWREIVSTALSMGECFHTEGSVAWYRGERDVTWKLKSTLHRYAERFTERHIKPLTEDERISDLREDYKTLYRRFQADAWPLLEEHERSDWGVVFAMQHFSLPTRLLDWSESFACAVFFAQLGRKQEDPASIWVLDPHQLNKLGCGRLGIVALHADTADPATPPDPMQWHPSRVPPPEPLQTIAVAPTHTNPRMVQQRARFTQMGDSFLPLDEQFDGELVRQGRLRRIVLPPETFADAEEFLSAAGLDAFSFFPDLQGLALKHQAQVEGDIRLAKKTFPDLFR
jgi:hypothetical protein